MGCLYGHDVATDYAFARRVLVRSHLAAQKRNEGGEWVERQMIIIVLVKHKNGRRRTQCSYNFGVRAVTQICSA